MTEENKNPAPTSPEAQSAEVRRTLEQDEVTHQGQPAVPVEGEDDSQRHMGTVETDVTPITPPMAGPSDLLGKKGDSSQPDRSEDPQSELTPG